MVNVTNRRRRTPKERARDQEESPAQTRGPDEILVRNSDTIIIPGRHEGLVQGKVDEGSKERIAVVEPRKITTPGVMAVRCLVRVTKGCCQVRLINLSDDDITIPKKTILGQLEDCVEDVRESKSKGVLRVRALNKAKEAVIDKINLDHLTTRERERENR